MANQLSGGSTGAFSMTQQSSIPAPASIVGRDELPQSEVERELQRLSARINDLTELANVLSERLAPVRIQCHAGEGNDASKIERSVESPLGADIRSIDYRAENAQNILRRLLLELAI